MKNIIIFTRFVALIVFTSASYPIEQPHVAIKSQSCELCGMKKNDQSKLEQMRQHIEACNKSGLTVRDYCQQNAVVKSSYYYWLKKLNGKNRGSFEKRFRKVVGTTPEKFASIVRFNTVLDNLNDTKSLTDICYENNFFDQAHFIKDFKQFTGDTPEQFKRFLQKNDFLQLHYFQLPHFYIAIMHDN